MYVCTSTLYVSTSIFFKTKNFYSSTSTYFKYVHIMKQSPNWYLSKKLLILYCKIRLKAFDIVVTELRIK